MVVSVFRIKIYAVYLGPVGFGLISQLFNFYLLFTSVIHMGVPVSITSEMSKLNSSDVEKDKSKINSYFRYFTSRIFIITIIFSALIIYFSVDITDFLVEDKNFYYFIIIIFIAAPFGVMYTIIESFLRSFQKIEKIVKISILTNIISLLALLPLIYYFKYIGVSFYWLIFGLLPFVLVFFVAKKFVKDISRDKGYLLSGIEKRLIFKIGSISLLSSLMHQGVIILIRKLLIAYYGYEENGIYQSVLSISLSYFGFLYIFLTNYTFPKISSCNDDKSIISELNINARFLLLIMIPMMLFFYGFKDLGILVFFSKNFINARELLFPQFLGDIFRVGAALFGLWMIPRYKMTQIILIDIVFNSIFLILLILFIKILSLPLIFVAIAYFIAFFCHFIMFLMYSKYSIKFKFDKKVKLTFIYSMTAFISIYASSYYNKYFGYISTIIIMIIWLFLVIDRNEMISLKNIFVKYIDKKNSK